MTAPGTKPTFEDRCIGCLLGTACGDILGARVEGWPAAEIRETFGELRDFSESGRGFGRFTDDTQMTLTVELGNAAQLNRVRLQEYIQLGQRIEAFAVDARVDGTWQEIATGTTIGPRRILRTPTYRHFARAISARAVTRAGSLVVGGCSCSRRKRNAGRTATRSRCRRPSRLWITRLWLSLAVVMQKRKTRGFTSIIDPDDLARGRNNVATRPWAKKLADAIKKDADWWLEQSDDFIYSLVPAGNPRAICPSFEYGCPIHGGARSSFTATVEAPCRWKCKKGGEEWYDGAVIKNPKTGESITVHDDGNGWPAPEGFLKPGVRYYFVGAYRYFLLGKLFYDPYEPDGGSKYTGGSPVVQLALAYTLTGDARYAHKCAVMLNRLAEL